MSNDVLVVVEYLEGDIADISFEMVGKGKELAGAWGGQLIALVLGSSSATVANSFASDVTIYVDDPSLAQYTPEAYGRVVEAIVAERSPRLIMFGSTSMGMDLAAWLSVRSERSCIAYVGGLELEDGALVITSRIYAGKMAAEVAASSDPLIVTILSGAFDRAAGEGSTPADQVSAPVSLDGLKTRFVRLIKPVAGDVDITTQDKLVAVGRGIGSEDNLELAEELAGMLDATVAASRPITDAGWLPKTRQVGKSGVRVSPKLYLMLGISGAPEHLEGMRNAELIIAVNTDADAPIFDVAHYGTTSDLFDVAEAMLEALE